MPAPVAGRRRTSAVATAAVVRGSRTASGGHPTTRYDARRPGAAWRSGPSRRTWRAAAGPARVGTAKRIRSGPASSRPTTPSRSSSVANRCPVSQASSARAAMRGRASVNAGDGRDGGLRRRPSWRPRPTLAGHPVTRLVTRGRRPRFCVGQESVARCRCLSPLDLHGSRFVLEPGGRRLAGRCRPRGRRHHPPWCEAPVVAMTTSTRYPCDYSISGRLAFGQRVVLRRPPAASGTPPTAHRAGRSAPS